MDTTLDQLTVFTHRTTAVDLPPEVSGRVAGILVDTLGCLVGGRGCRAVVASRGLVSDAVRAVEWGTALTQPGRYPAEVAAFINTASTRYLDHNDHLVAGHPSDMTGAMLAVLDRPGHAVSGPDLITAIAVAYEVHARVVRLMRHNNTIDRTYSIVIGATAGVCNLLGLSLDVTREALSMAVNCGPMLRAARAGELSDFKGAASAVAARDAVFFSLVAEQGLTGPSAPFGGRHGLRELFEGEQGEVTIAPFDSWMLLETCTKYWPVAYGIQPAIWTGVELRDKVRLDEIERVVLHAAPFAWFESGTEPERWDPRSRESADHSLPYAFARAFRHGRVDADSFEPEAYRDAETLGLMQRVAVEPDWNRGPKISDVVGCRAVVSTTDGREIVVNVDEPMGHHRNPMNPEAISDKARRLMTPHLGEATEAALEAAWTAGSAERLDVLLVAFAPPAADGRG